MIPYILHVSILIAGCYIFYWLLLRQETFFKLNRGVLIACLVIPMILPLITIPASWALQINPSSQIRNNKITSNIENNNTDVPVVFKETELAEIVEPSSPKEAQQTPTISPSQESSNSSISIMQLLPKIYLTGVFVFAIAFLIQLILILAKIASLNSMQDGKYKIVELVKDEAPYSFWNTIFINPTMYDPDTYNQIIAHEKIHIDQTHFMDMLIVELSVIAFWFNPFVWLFRKAITNNLEFLTDESMLTQGFPKQSYQMSLLKVSVPQYPLNLTTNYNQSFLKNRIAMMNTKRSSAQSIWKYLFILPLLGFSMMSLNAVKSISNNTNSDVLLSPDSIKEPEPETNLNNIKSPSIDKDNAQKESMEEEEPISEENKQLREEVMSSLRKDNLLTDDDPVFKLFPNKILLNEKPLNSKLRKKYKAIFEKHGVTPDKSRLLIVKPLVIMSGTFVGNQNADNGTHVDIFDEEENQDSGKDEVTVHTVTTTTTDRSTGNKISVTTIDGKTYINGQGTYTHNGKTYNKWGDEIQVIDEDGNSYILDDPNAVEKALSKAHEKSHKTHLKKAIRKTFANEHVDDNSNDGKGNRHIVTTTVNGKVKENFTIRTEDGRTFIHGKGTHTINGRTYTNNKDKVLVIDEDGDSYHIENPTLDEDDLVRIVDGRNISNNELSGIDKHHLKSSAGKGNSDFYSSKTILKSSTNSLWQLPEFVTSFYQKLINEQIIDNGDKMIFYLGESGAFVNGHHLSSQKANQFVTLAKKYGYYISRGFNLEYDGNNLLITDMINDINYFRRDLLKQLEADGYISNKKKKMVLEIYGNRLSVNGEKIPNNKFTTYFNLFKEYNIVPSPGKTIETSTKKGKKNIQVGYQNGNATLGTFASF